jgi:hypothetical protein
VIADRCGVDLEDSFVRTMDDLDRALASFEEPSEP